MEVTTLVAIVVSVIAIFIAGFAVRLHYLSEQLANVRDNHALRLSTLESIQPSRYERNSVAFRLEVLDKVVSDQFTRQSASHLEARVSALESAAKDAKQPPNAIASEIKRILSAEITRTNATVASYANKNDSFAKAEAKRALARRETLRTVLSAFENENPSDF